MSALLVHFIDDKHAHTQTASLMAAGEVTLKASQATGDFTQEVPEATSTCRPEDPEIKPPFFWLVDDRSSSSATATLINTSIST